MKFSILIAHYNNSNYFKDCYESLISQTYPNWEAIILDDGSEGNEKSAIKSLIDGDPRFKFFENEQNSGVGYTKAKLIELASGDICGFVDPDDAIGKNAIETLISQFTKKEIVAVYSQLYFCDQNLQITQLLKNSTQIKNNNRYFFNITFNVNHFFSFRKENYLQTEGIDCLLSSAVDQDLYLKLYETGDFKFVKEPLYLYRRHDSGVSQDLNKKVKLYKNWNQVLLNTCKRRGLSKIGNREVSNISNLAEFIYENQNTLLTRIRRKLQSFL